MGISALISQPTLLVVLEGGAEGREVEETVLFLGKDGSALFLRLMVIEANRLITGLNEGFVLCNGIGVVVGARIDLEIKYNLLIVRRLCFNSLKAIHRKGFRGAFFAKLVNF